jgi:hypothetical protein
VFGFLIMKIASALGEIESYLDAVGPCSRDLPSVKCEEQKLPRPRRTLAECDGISAVLLEIVD